MPEFLGLGRRGPGHPGQLLIHPEIILEGDRGQGLVFLLDPDSFLGLQSLVQTVAVAAAGHKTAGELVDDDHLAVLDHVIDVALEEEVGFQGLVQAVNQVHLGEVVQVGDVKGLFGRGHALLQERNGPRFLVDLEMRVGREAADHRVGLLVEIGRALARTGDDEGGPGFVDQDRVDLVDDGVIEGPLDQVRQPEFHIVAQVVEAELVVGAVGDVGPVGS
ncbi:MAG: hypothetical protein BWX98_01567 [Candidatus Aminicenantes bacterium ADurb.Bin147]|nr:MAG: hypothetical protein BWX98_01567 [Candidatus Aminicenantes bacterium ADurb.Bin147]